MDIPPWAPTLTDRVVTLRAHRPSDVDGVLAQGSDPVMQRWTSVPIPYQPRHATEWIGTRRDDWESGHRLSLAIEHEGRFAGAVDLRPEGPGAAEIGYGLGPWARGHGVMGRTLRLVLPWAFGELGLEVVHWRAAAGNWASRRVAWAAGFRVEGLVRGLLDDHGTRQDAWIGSLRRDDPLTPAHPWHTPPVLQDSHVQLRPHREDDVERIVAAAVDPLTQRWLPALPGNYTAADAAAHLEDIREQESGGHAMYWAVADPLTSRLCGEIGMFGLASASRSGELGYWAHPDSRGRGLITRGVRLAARHGLLPGDVGGLGMVRLVIRAAADNAASQRVALSAGFRPAGRDRCAERLRDGTLADLHRFELIEAELGGTADDRTADGRTTDGRTTDGRATDGRATDGRATDDAVIR
jgi:RimJ/RimL family protein N-acetyltransferase